VLHLVDETATIKDYSEARQITLSEDAVPVLPAPPRRHDHQHPRAITVTRDPPAAPRIACALALLLDQINAAPPRMPGDTRLITYQLAAPPQI
jgi:hypothetical protein